MDMIVKDLVKVMKKEKKFLKREQVMMLFFAQLIQTIVQLAFQQLDEEVSAKLKEEGFQVDRKSQRTVTFLFGSISYVRRRMKNKAGDIRYPLDEFLGIRKGIRYSSLVLRNVSELGSMMVYRHVAQAIDCLTTWSMSHQNVQQLVVKTGKIVQKRSTHESRYEGITQKKKVRYLYLEGDGVLIRGQKKQRLEIHRFQVSEGSQVAGNRSQLICPYFVSHLNRKSAQKEMMNYLQATYDLSDTVVISNSDGGSGYEKEVFDELSLGCFRHEHFRDSYHVHQKIKERLNFVSPKLQNKLIEAIRLYENETVRACLDTAESLIEEREETYLEQVRLLRGYLTRNWVYVKSLEQRGIHDSNQSIGTIESTHRKMTYRMKRQGRLWSKAGAAAMIRVIDSLRNQEMATWLNQYEEVSDDEVERQKQWKAMKRKVQKTPPFRSHEGVFKGIIGQGLAKSEPIGQLSKELNQLNMTPSYF